MSSKYQFGPKIGAGGMADVYKGFDSSLQRHVAIKVMKATMVDNTRFVERFGREARVNARLRHQNIVQVYDLGEADGCPMLIMELLEGETLKDRLQRGALSEAHAVTITRQVLQALAFAQEQEKVVHRDIKPGNVFLSRGWDAPDAPDGLVKLMDFGIASAAAEMQVTVGGERFGTPDYMSPEQASGKTTEFPTDSYAVGVMLYEMLSGTTPFRADNPLVVMNLHVSAPPPPLPQTVSPHLRTVVMTALTKDPAARYPNARAMGGALLGRNSGSWPSIQQQDTIGIIDNPQPVRNKTTQNFETTAPKPQPKPGPNFAVIGGGAVCLAAVGGMVVLLMGGAKSGPTPVSPTPKPSASVAVANVKPSPNAVTTPKPSVATPASTPPPPRPSATPRAEPTPTRRPVVAQTPRPRRRPETTERPSATPRPKTTITTGNQGGSKPPVNKPPKSINDLAPD